MLLDSDIVIPKLKEQFLKDCLTNKTYGEREWEFYGRLFNLRIDAGAVRLLLLEILGNYDFEHVFALGNIAEELIEQAGKRMYLSTTIGRSVVILVGEDSIREWRELLKTVKQVYKQYFKLEFAAVISGAGSVQHIRSLYKEASAYLSNRLYAAKENGLANGEASGEDNVRGGMVRRMVQYVKEHADNEALTLSYMANKVFYMNADYLGKVFKKGTGMKFSDYLMRFRINEAKRWISSADSFHVCEIAEKLGFGNNPQYFSQAFKKLTGYTPTEYKKKCLPNNNVVKNTDSSKRISVNWKE